LSICWIVLNALSATAWAGSVTLGWNANGQGTVGYIVAYGTRPGVHPVEVDVGNQTTWTVTGLLEGRRYYFVVYAYDVRRLTSLPSLEVSGVVPPDRCPVILSAGSMSFEAAGGESTNALFIPASCNWTVSAAVPWLTVMSGAVGSGNGAFAVKAGPWLGAASRSALLAVRGSGGTVVPVEVVQQGTPDAVRIGPRWDLDGDRRTDLTVWQPETGRWLSQFSSDPSPEGTAFTWGQIGDSLVPADYDGDGLGDYAVWRPEGGIWSLETSSSQYTQVLQIQWGEPGDVPVPADYDGDGRADVAVWRRDTGTWYIRTSASDYGTSVVIDWPLDTDHATPVPADYDGDGRADIAIRNEQTGTWRFLKSHLDFDAAHPFTLQWPGGWPGDLPIAGDFDGDGMNDVGAWGGGDQSVWRLLLSTHGYSPRMQLALAHGSAAAGDIPVLGDYDGDSRTDMTVWRRSEGLWITVLSHPNYDGMHFTTWGSQSDIPVP